MRDPFDSTGSYWEDDYGLVVSHLAHLTPPHLKYMYRLYGSGDPTVPGTPEKLLLFKILILLFKVYGVNYNVLRIMSGMGGLRDRQLTSKEI